MSEPTQETERPFAVDLWRGALWVGAVMWSMDAVLCLVLGDWSGAWHALIAACAFGYILRLEHTLDRWQPFVPPSQRRRP